MRLEPRWHPAGRSGPRTLTAGDAVLDLCCGVGASAIPAERAAGPAGHVQGVDVTGPLLAMARAKATREDLANIEFRQGDATRSGLADGSFDAVVARSPCSSPPIWRPFVAEMWRLVRTGGVRSPAELRT